MITARESAADILYEVLYRGAYSNLALKEFLAAHRDMPPAEKSLLTNLVYGVVSRHYTLIYIIRQRSSVRLNKLDKRVAIILQLGLYQLLYTDKIPESAAVNESVKLAKKCGSRAAGFVNAILRSFIRDGKVIEYPADTVRRLSVMYSYSTEMTELFINNFATRAESIMSALNEPPQLVLRANILKNSADGLLGKLSAAGIKAEPLEGALVSAAGFDIAASRLYHEGCFSVQDRAAYNAALALAPESGETIIDMCAAPGGKATHIAELMGDRGTVIACDIYEHKLELINQAAKRLGLTSVSARLSDGTTEDSSLIGAADRVLCDVPCSGLGVIRRKPDIKLGRQNTADLPLLQAAILKNGAKYVKPGGVLVYSTCTLNKAENEDVAQSVSDSGGFIKLAEKTYLPDKDGTDGFYICKMQKI